MYVLVYNCITIYSLMQNYLWKFTVKCTFLVPMALFFEWHRQLHETKVFIIDHKNQGWPSKQSN